MHTEHEPGDPKELEAMGFDRRDINVPVIRKWTIWTLALSLFLIVISVPIYKWMTIEGPFWATIRGEGRVIQTKSNIRITSPNPILQDNVTTKVDIESMRQREDKILQTPAWVDQSKGVIRIPIEQAMTLIAERGVSTGKTVVAKPEGNTIPQNAINPAAPNPATQK